MRCDGLPTCEHCQENARIREIVEKEELRKQRANVELHEALKNFARAYNITIEDSAAAVMETFGYRYPPDELGKAGEKQFQSYNK